MTIVDQIASAKKVLILGYGREGQSTHKFLSSCFPHLEIATADQKDGPDYLAKIANHQIIIKTPGISPHLPEVSQAIKSGKLVTSQTQLFLELCPGKIIGVTGTKGKSTTTSLIYHVLSQNNIPAVLLGNIGNPPLDYLDQGDKNTYFVFEMSSYQLMDVTKSPHIAVLQAIYADHLDYHKDFQEYKNAKLNITKFQTADDYLICQTDDIPTHAQKILFSLSDYDPEIKTHLLGNHNKLNILPSIIIGKLLDLTQENIYSAISTFQPLETRLQSCGTFKGITFYADTLATIPEATIAAIDTLSPSTLIAGGHDRHQNYAQLAQKILSSGISTLILFPVTGNSIKTSLLSASKGRTLKESPKMFSVNSMQEAVSLAFKHTPSGKICLLSPAAPSFTLFKDYKDEAQQYQQQILEHS